MKRFLTSIALIIAIFSRILGQNENPEIYYSQGEFDSDTCCWRKLANSGKYEDGANLIVEYLKKGKTENRHSLK
ncbi:hypothetical protein LJB75_01585, partial [Bacteroidales bacterium OttesenSCG-928-L19]|nr:hypothetical protein [Bacteroidales bacterium OttesenSCG-928-L19]